MPILVGRRTESESALTHRHNEIRYEVAFVYIWLMETLHAVNVLRRLWPGQTSPYKVVLCLIICLAEQALSFEHSAMRLKECESTIEVCAQQSLCPDLQWQCVCSAVSDLDGHHCYYTRMCQHFAADKTYTHKLTGNVLCLQSRSQHNLVDCKVIDVVQPPTWRSCTGLLHQPQAAVSTCRNIDLHTVNVQLPTVTVGYLSVSFRCTHRKH